MAGAMVDFVGVAVEDLPDQVAGGDFFFRRYSARKSFADTVKGIEVCSAGEWSEKKLISIFVSLVGGESSGFMLRPSWIWQVDGL